MSETPTEYLLWSLVFLIIVSGFFSSSETGMMSLNRYKLRHLAKNKHRGAMLASRLLDRTDRLIGLILIGNNFVNFLASAIVTIVWIDLFGENSIAISTIIFTFVVLIFAEVTPKTIAALHPEKIAYPAAFVLTPLLYIFYPFVWMVISISNALLKLMKIDAYKGRSDKLNADELRTVVGESSGLIPKQSRGMLLNILDLEKITVNDIMVPRNEIDAINIDDDINTIMDEIRNSQFTLLPIYKSDINNIIGMLHLRRATRFMSKEDISKSAILQETQDPYFIPTSTSLYRQLINFKKNKRRFALVVDEYGNIQGIVTLADLLEEIVGEFTTDLATTISEVHLQEDGSWYIDGTATIRDINRQLKWSLPTDGPKTISGLILDFLEEIPDSNVCIRVENYYIETIHIQDNLIKTSKIWLATDE